MELPEGYYNWMDVAKETNKVLLEHTEAREIIFSNGINNQKYIINDIKAMALDEIMKHANFSLEDVMDCRDSILKQFHQSGRNELESMIKVLLKLIK